ncbi:catalase-related domain-containing protein [Streptomyces sp. NPDC005795]|uniref:catalase-related domain-containing protein n=1 Tax=Streptomyces sp. NPDC005795 TaxID=3154677 RepID=UPI0033CD1CC1
MVRGLPPALRGDDFTQAGNMVRKVLDDDARERPIGNVTCYLLNKVSRPVLERAVHYWRNVGRITGDRIARGALVTGRPRTLQPNTPQAPLRRLGRTAIRLRLPGPGRYGV